MGNRAVVHFKVKNPENFLLEKQAVYLHWHGSPEQVLAFLSVLEERGWARADYASARFVAVVAECMDFDGSDTGLSVGVLDDVSDGQYCDHGIYYVECVAGKFEVVQELEGERNPITVDSISSDGIKIYRQIIESLRASREFRRQHHNRAHKA